MTEGLLAIAMAASHLESQPAPSAKGKAKEPLSRQQVAILVPPAPEPLVSKIIAMTSSSTATPGDEAAGASEDDRDPEETLAQLLAEQPKDIPEAPSSTTIITVVQPDDVLCGRGGETNHHPGNVQYRMLVKKYQKLYLKAKRRDKPKIARLIVNTVRRRNGRFLKKADSTGEWTDVGNNKAREKTSQALREGAPEIREGDSSGKRKSGVVYNQPAAAAPMLYYATGAVPPPPVRVSPASSSQSLLQGEEATTAANNGAAVLAYQQMLAQPSPAKKLKAGGEGKGPRLKNLKSRFEGEEPAVEKPAVQAEV